MEEFEIIQNAFDAVSNGLREEYASFYIRYFIETEIVDDEAIELGMFQTSSTNKFGEISYFENSDFQLLFTLKKHFEDLRILMSTKHLDKPTWDEAIMRYEKGGRVKMEYKYPSY